MKIKKIGILFNIILTALLYILFIIDWKVGVSYIAILFLVELRSFYILFNKEIIGAFDYGVVEK